MPQKIAAPSLRARWVRVSAAAAPKPKSNLRGKAKKLAVPATCGVFAVRDHPKKSSVLPAVAPAPRQPPHPPSPLPARGTGWQLWRWGRRAPQRQGRSRQFPGLIREEWGWEPCGGGRTRAGITSQPSSCFTVPGTPHWGRSGPARAPREPSRGCPPYPTSNSACLLDVRGPPFLSPRSQGCPKPGISFLWMDPTGWSVTRSSACVPGRMQAGRDGNGVTLSGLGSFLPRRWQGAGRAGACWSPLFCWFAAARGAVPTITAAVAAWVLEEASRAACMEPRAVAQHCPPPWGHHPGGCLQPSCSVGAGRTRPVPQIWLASPLPLH